MKTRKSLLTLIAALMILVLAACTSTAEDAADAVATAADTAADAAADAADSAADAAAEAVDAAATAAAEAAEAAGEAADAAATTAAEAADAAEDAMDDAADAADDAMDDMMGGCSPAEDGAYAGIDPSGQQITWWHQHSGSREEGLLEMVADFNADNECGITVEAINQGGYDDIRDKVNVSIGAGELPAALLVGYQNDQAFYQLNDTLVNLDDLIFDHHWGLSAEEADDFYSGFFNQGIHTSFDNQRLGFPPNRSIEVMYYNKTWLEELGFSDPPTSPDEFRDMACAAAEANGDGTGGYILRDDASAVAAWTFAFGGDVLSEDGEGYVYNGDATVEALTFLKGMLDDGCAYFFTDGFPNPEFAARRALFTQGSTSGMRFYAGDIATFAEESSSDPDVWGVTAIPYTGEPTANVYGADVMITKTTAEQELAAWLFAKWFTQPENQARWLTISSYFPTRAGTADHLDEFVPGTAMEGFREQYDEALALLEFGKYEPQLISYSSVRDEAQKAYNEIMQGADIQSTLDALTEFANEQQAELMEDIE